MRHWVRSEVAVAALPRSPDYGLDAPGLARGFLIACAVAFTLALASHLLQGGTDWFRPILTFASAVIAAYTGFMGLLMVIWSKAIKARERDALLARIPWCGNETVLDVGCGRGLMLIGAALRLTTGRAIGIDIWSQSDQSGNSPEAAIANATSAGVAERVEVQTADMRRLPFAPASFDAVLSHWAVHNLEAEADREAAISEMVRVLRPGGHLLLADIVHRDAYLKQLADAGLRIELLHAPALRDMALATLSFGSFRPFAILAQLPDASGAASPDI